MSETWLPVAGWESLYEVSDLGRVRSLPRWGGAGRWYGGKVLVPYPNKGYPMVPLCRHGTRTMHQVHTLVLKAFTGPCPPGMQCCHGNGDPGDSTLANLRWDTPVANAHDTYRHGTRIAGERHPAARLSDADVSEIRRRHAAGVASSEPRITHQRLADMYGVERSHITMILNGKSRVPLSELTARRVALGLALVARLVPDRRTPGLQAPDPQVPVVVRPATRAV